MPLDIAVTQDLVDLEKRIYDDLGGGGGSLPDLAWQDVRAAFLFTVRGEHAKWINVGDGEFVAEAYFLPGLCKLHVSARFGNGWSTPNPTSQWVLYPLTGRVKPIRRAVGNLRLWAEGQGSITGGQSIIGFADPNYYFTMLWTPLNAGPGFLTGIYPQAGGGSIWTRNGSYFIMDIDYRVA